ncbi:MAG: OmpA family protein [Desulfobacteraceae bacterium]|nr:OmpA family protein [Desulfobacteraceae bacterium]
MAKKMKTSAKVFFFLGFLAIVFAVLKYTGIIDKSTTPESSRVADTSPKVPDTPRAGEPEPVTAALAEVSKDSSIPKIDDIRDEEDIAASAIPGTTLVRLGHWTWNSHQAWAYANKGKETAKDSHFAKNGITVQFIRMEEIPLQVSGLVKFARAFKQGEKNPKKGIHFFTIMGDAGGWVLNDTNSALKAVDSSYEAEIIGFGGFSAGEDKFMGLPEWKKNPQSARGGLVAGVAADGDWNVMIFWCAQNKVPFNSDKRYYDPDALNFLEVDSFLKAADVYIEDKPVELIFKNNGKNYRGKSVKKGEKGLVAITGSVTWTPGDKNIADQKGGLVSIVSTKEYSNQMPQYVVGLKQWNRKNKNTVVRVLASVFEAADKINLADEALRGGKIQPRSGNDLRWEAAKYANEIFGSETREYWYKYFNVVKVRDKKGLFVEVGGSSVSNLPRNIEYFGLERGINIGEVVYNRFAKLAMYYYPEFMDSYPAWSRVFNPSYLLEVRKKYPYLAREKAYLPEFKKEETGGSQLGELTFNIPFASGKATFTQKANAVLTKALEELVIAANARVEIHGHTDSQGNDDANFVLSEKRASAVKTWLESHAGSSFPENRVTAIPHGEKDLLVTDFADGKYIPDATAKNRRVVLKIFSKKD